MLPRESRALWEDALPQEDALTQIDDLASKVAEKSFEYLKSNRDL